MAATIEGTIAELMGVLRDINGIQYAPDEPNEQVTAWPAAFGYPVAGRLADGYPSGMYTVKHTVEIALMMPENDYRLMTKIIVPLIDPVYNALVSYNNDQTSSHFNTFATISYTLGGIPWTQGQDMYGVVFTLEDVKIMNNLV